LLCFASRPTTYAPLTTHSPQTHLAALDYAFP
jgi:hypothetical protein